jgi:DNA-binding NarL/FixJ family response regulator
MVGLCTDCPSRTYCSTLCPEAELYAKQDEVEQKELTIGIPKYGKWPDALERNQFTPMERKILHALLDGKTRKKISEDLEISRETLRKHLGNIRKKREENLLNMGGE